MQDGLWSLGISEEPESEMTREPLVYGLPAQDRNSNVLPLLLNAPAVPGACNARPRSDRSSPLARLMPFRLTETLSMVPDWVGSVSPLMFVGPGQSSRDMDFPRRRTKG